jgi:hypothetical protein
LFPVDLSRRKETCTKTHREKKQELNKHNSEFYFHDCCAVFLN